MRMFAVLPLVCTVLFFQPSPLSAAQPPILDQLVLFTPSANAYFENLPASEPIPPPGRVSRALDYVLLNANLVASNSRAYFRHRSVTATATFIDYDEHDDTNDKVVLDELTKGVGVFAGAHEQRDALGADGIILIVNALNVWSDWSGGDANVMYENSVSTSEYAPFAIVDCAYIEIGNAFYHEVGHTLGLQHDWYVSAQKKVPYPYSFGYNNCDANFRTIMDYPDECEAEGNPSCPRILFYSNPDVLYNGLPIGVMTGKTDCVDGEIPSTPCDANAALSMNQTAPTFSKFRSQLVDRLVAPVLLSPSGTDQLSTFTPTFTFASVGSATHYRILVGVAPSTSLALGLGNVGGDVLAHTLFSANDICSGATCKISSVEDLPSVQFSSGNHYWSIRAENTSGALGTFADAMAFVLGSTTPTGAPTVTQVGPGNFTYANRPPLCPTPTFVWNAATGENDPGTPAATEYEVIVFNVDTNEVVYVTPFYDAKVVCQEYSDGQKLCALTPTQTLAAGPNYLWRVRANSAYGRGPNSARLYFTVDASMCCAGRCAADNCGKVADGCGGTLYCGGCNASSQCVGGVCTSGGSFL